MKNLVTCNNFQQTKILQFLIFKTLTLHNRVLLTSDVTFYPLYVYNKKKNPH